MEEQNKAVAITLENFQNYLGCEVRVEIYGKLGGLLYPDRNVLIGMNKGEFFFKSIEEDGINQYWSWDYSEDGENWHCDVFSMTEQNKVPSPDKWMEELEKEVEVRYPVATHSNPELSPYRPSQKTFTHGAEWAASYFLPIIESLQKKIGELEASKTNPLDSGGDAPVKTCNSIEQ